MDYNDLIRSCPVAAGVAALEETTWVNPNKKSVTQIGEEALGLEDVLDAARRLDRFSSYFREVFPQTRERGGLLESPLRRIPAMQAALGTFSGKLWIKLDSHLPISGSIKARGGIYEVLYTAERIAKERGLLKPGMSYECFSSEEFRKVFSEYSIAVGSTGNLGLSIGIMSAQLGFRVTVHMSADARQWKKDMLRSKGVTVMEYEQDYSIAVAQGREQAKSDPYCHFIDDENSQTLFLGYSVAALRLKDQLTEAGVIVDADHPLFVYLPCGVGGGPGGVAFGLRKVFGDHVHCFFAEPTHSAAMILGMATGLHNEISVQDLGVDNKTVADGLAVGRASGFVGKLMEPHMDGCYTITDERMERYLALLADREDIFLEPSALAGMQGPLLVEGPLKACAKDLPMENATHLVWATGGSMVPKDEMEKYYQRGKALL